MSFFIDYIKKHLFKTLLLSFTIPAAVFVSGSFALYAGWPSFLSIFAKPLVGAPWGIVILPLRLISLICAPVGFIVLVVSLFLWRKRKYAVTLAGVILLLNFLGSVIADNLSLQLRYHSMKKIGVSAQPIIEAIEKYYSVNKDYPNKLDDLKPKYLLRIPEPEPFAAPPVYKEFVYRKSIKPESKKCIQPNYEHSELNFKWIDAKSNYYCTGGYELAVRVPLNGLNWDVFVYWPNKQYPAEMYHGDVARLDDWAYVNE